MDVVDKSKQAQKQNKGGDPESRFYDTLKKKPVAAKLSDGITLCGVLEWVSTYSVGIEVRYIVEDGQPVSVERHTKLVNKGHLVTICADPLPAMT